MRCLSHIEDRELCFIPFLLKQSAIFRVLRSKIKRKSSLDISCTYQSANHVQERKKFRQRTPQLGIERQFTDKTVHRPKNNKYDQCGQTLGTAMKNHTIITRYQENKLSKIPI